MIFKLCCALALGLGPAMTAVAEQKGDPRRSTVTITDDGQGSRVVIEGAVVNRAVGPGAVAETNIGGRRSTARGEDAKGAAERQRPDQVPTKGDLVNLDLAGRALAGSHWSARRLVNVDLSGADLRGADLRRATLTNVDLSGADLRDANLIGAQLVNVDVDGVRLRGARLMDGRLCTSDSCSFQ